MKGYKAVFITAIVFCIVFGVVFLANTGFARSGFTEANSDSIAITNWGGDPAPVQDFFVKYGILMGVGLGVVSLILSLILYGIFNSFSKSGWATPTALFLSYLPWLVSGIELAFYENRYTLWSNGIIFFMGYPMMYTAIVSMIVIITLHFVRTGEKKEEKR